MYEHRLELIGNSKNIAISTVQYATESWEGAWKQAWGTRA